MNSMMSPAQLESENGHYLGSGGRSQENAGIGFRPAFLDPQTRTVYLSRFADGRPAPFHVLDGLPDALIAQRHIDGRVARTRVVMISGFVRGGEFFTRDQAAAAVAAIH